MRTWFGCLSLVLLACLLAGGCTQPSGNPTLLESRAQPYVADIPVPAGFQRDERKSTYAYTAGTRSVKDFYRGEADMLAVCNFYKHHMPMSNWETKDESLGNTVYLLTYRKGNEQCEIRIERIPLGAFRGSVTQIRAIVAPDAQ